jgi:hypothetical protein
MPTSQFGELAQVNSYGIAVSASSNADYTLSGEDRNGDVSGNDPNLTFKVGDEVTFSVNVAHCGTTWRNESSSRY